MANSFCAEMCAHILFVLRFLLSQVHLLEGAAPSGVPGAQSAGGLADAAGFRSMLAASVYAYVVAMSPLQQSPP